MLRVSEVGVLTVDRRVPGHSSALGVTPAEVAAAKLQVKRAKQRGEEVDPAIEAIAQAEPEQLLRPVDQDL